MALDRARTARTDLNRVARGAAARPERTRGREALDNEVLPVALALAVLEVEAQT